jgi:hypothetical protein
VSRKISLDCLAFAARSCGTGPRRKSVWRWLGIGVLSVAVLALFAPASWAQEVDPVTVDVQVNCISNCVDGNALFGATFEATAAVTINDGSTILSPINWTQSGGVPAVLNSDSGDTITGTLEAAESAYKDELVSVLSEPPIGPEELPENVPIPEEPFPGGLQNRFQIMPANPFALEEAAKVALQAEVTTTSGTYVGEGAIHTELRWKVKGDIQNVALGIPVLLHGKDGQASYNWTLRRPWNSSATLMDATSQNPEFTPDVRGLYRVYVTDTAESKTVRLYIYAGEWTGAITGQGEDGRPLAGNCTPCHREGGKAPDVFTPWRQTGHAEIFTNNLNTSTHYGDSCFACHTVGFDLGVFNNGADDATDYQNFLNSGLLNNPGDNWTTVLADYPNFARKANIQCENCHGPQRSLAHNQRYPKPGVTGLRPRVDISANLCGVCHGEPLRHARFQQWQLSKHADYELAVDEGESGNCSRCHTANGFLTWVPVLLGEVAGDPLDNITVTWAEDKIHPQTCPVCHDPHQIGTTTGNNTNATTRISDETPLLVAGFKASGVGRGAMCMTCHNTRRGLRNEVTWDPTADITRGPHGGVQTDLLMGQNAYFIDLGDIVAGEDYPEGLPGSHANQRPLLPEDILKDTCATCHMVTTPPPDLLAYNLGGTNHTFFASEDICQECHDPNLININTVQSQIIPKLDTLRDKLVTAILAIMEQEIAAGNTIDLDGEATITDVTQIAEIVFGESHGRQAITVTFTDNTTFGPYRIDDVVVRDGSEADLGNLYAHRANDNLPKAGWNYLLVETDKSFGVHNFFFALNVLDASIAALP